MRNVLLYLIVIALFFVTGCSDSSDNSPTPAELLNRYTLSSPDSIPEGIAFDPVERAFYVTSLQGGSITRIDADGTERLFRQADDRARIAGAKIDADKRLLWVCAKFVDGVDDRVWVLDLNTGELVQEYLLGALTSGGACNDLTLTDEGEVAYVSDSSNPFIYRLNALTGEGSILATDPLFEDIVGQGVGINGLVVTPDRKALIVAKSVPSQLFRVSIPDGNDITTITLSGDPLVSLLTDTPLGTVPFGGDGLALLGDYIYAVTPRAVSRILLNDDYSAGQVVTIPQIDGIGLTTATVAEGSLYVIKSEVASFVLEQPLDLPFEFFKVNLDEFNLDSEDL
jgi:sugar lactone lactonase YvrE